MVAPPSDNTRQLDETLSMELNGAMKCAHTTCRANDFRLVLLVAINEAKDTKRTGSLGKAVQKCKMET